MARKTASPRFSIRPPVGAARASALVAASLLMLSGCGFVKELVGIEEDEPNVQIAEATPTAPGSAAPASAAQSPIAPTAAASAPQDQPAMRDPTLPWLNPSPNGGVSPAQPAAVPVPAVPQPAAGAAQAPKRAAPEPPAVPRVQPRLVQQPEQTLPAAPRVQAASQNVFALAPSPPATPVAATGPVAAAAGAAGPARGYAAHLASYRVPKNAEYGWNDLKRRFPSVLEGKTRLLRSVDLGAKGQFLRLLVGPFETKTQSEEICRPVRRAGQYCRVLKVSR
ncbi:MAG: hypothetical protein QNJ92_05620 [Alphaproteobacteria bacterium]|nr:hypothetical protein [Alphaproteobacteria bacterium]